MAARDSSRSSSADVDLWADTAGSGAEVAPPPLPAPSWASDPRGLCPGDASDSLDRERSSLGLDSHGDIPAALRAERPQGPRTRWRTDDAAMAANDACPPAEPQAPSRLIRPDTSALTLPGVLLTIAGLSVGVVATWRMLGRDPVETPRPAIGLPDSPAAAVPAGRGAQPAAASVAEEQPGDAPPPAEVESKDSAPTPAVAGPSTEAPTADDASALAAETRLRALLHAIRVATSQPQASEAPSPTAAPAPGALPPELARLSSPYAETLLGMARELEARGRAEAALKRYREIVAQYPGTQAATAAEARIALLEKAAATTPPLP